MIPDINIAYLFWYCKALFRKKLYQQLIAFVTLVFATNP